MCPPSPRPPAVTAVSIERVDGQLTVRLEAAAPTRVTVHVGAELGGGPGAHARVVLQVPAGGCAITLPAFAERHSVLVTDDAGGEWFVPERTVHLEGVLNLRDAGGYPVAGGGRVRWGCLYRSSAVVPTAAAGDALATRLGIRTVVDLRTEAERARTGGEAEWAPPGCALHHLPLRPVDDSASADEAARHERGVLDRILGPVDGTLDARGARRALELATGLAARAAARNYRGLLDSGRESLREVFLRLSAPDAAPALVQCAAGKDRTGLVCALVQTALGVPRELVLEDFALSNTLWARAALAPHAARIAAAGLEPEDVTGLFGVDPGALDTLLAVVDDHHGGVEGLVLGHLGLGREVLDGLARNLLV